MRTGSVIERFLNYRLSKTPLFSDGLNRLYLSRFLELGVHISHADTSGAVRAFKHHFVYTPGSEEGTLQPYVDQSIQ